MISEGYDAAIRVGETEVSSLRARKFAETTIRMVASPGYLQRAGRPRRIEDLGAHKLLHYTNQANGAVWKMTSQTGEKRQIRTTGSFTVNDGQSLLNAAINGLGIVYLPSFLYASALAEGRVVDVMPELQKETQGIYVVYHQVNLPNQRCVHLLIIWRKPLHAKGQITDDLLQNHRFDAAVLFTSLWCLIAGPWG